MRRSVAFVFSRSQCSSYTPQIRTPTAQVESGTVANAPQPQQKQAQVSTQARPAALAAVRQQTPQGTPRQ